MFFPNKRGNLYLVSEVDKENLRKKEDEAREMEDFFSRVVLGCTTATAALLSRVSIYFPLSYFKEE